LAFSGAVTGAPRAGNRLSGAALLLSAPYQLPCDRRMVNKIAGMRRDGFWAAI
jgi:hypothetical protein